MQIAPRTLSSITLLFFIATAAADAATTNYPHKKCLGDVKKISRAVILQRGEER